MYLNILNYQIFSGDSILRTKKTLLLVFLAQNNYLYLENGKKRIDDDTLIALNPFIATSNNGEKNMILKLIASFLSE